MDIELQVVHGLEHIRVWAGTPHRDRLLIIHGGVIVATTTTAARTPVVRVKQSIYVATTALAKEIRIICGGADANRLRGTAIKITQVMGLRRSISAIYRAIPGRVEILEFATNWRETHFRHV